MNRKTYTLLKVLIIAALAIVVVFVIAIVIPNILRSRQHTAMDACIANMKQLEGAREQALLAGQNASTSTILLHNTDIVLTNTVSR
jgi:competence protein ComGC